MSTVDVKVRLDSGVRDEMGRIANSLGMSVNTAFSVFANQFVSHRGFPFAVVEHVPTRAEFTDEMERRYFEMQAGAAVEHDLIEV